MSIRRLAWIVVPWMILAAVIVLYGPDRERPKSLVILHTNDLHGRVLEGPSHGIGFGKMSTQVENFRNSFDNVLLLDAGDAFHGLPMATLVRGESMVRLMNLVGYDVMTVGNHDFNYGQARLQELDAMADFPILAANVYKPDGSRLLQPYLIKEMDGLTVAIFGLVTPEALWKSHLAYVGDLIFADPVTEARAMVEELGEVAQVIIALGHLGIDGASAPEHRSSTVAQAVDGIDLFVDGHSHSVLEEGIRHGDTLLVSAGSHGAYLGVVEMRIDKDELSSSARLVSRQESVHVQEDPAVMRLLQELQQVQETALAQVVGETTVRLDGEREAVRGGETNLGNLVTDIMRHVSGADLALSNGGSIRASVDAGPITRGDIIAVFPFGNQLEVKQVSGAMVKQMLEHGTRAYPEISGGFPHVSGLSYQIDLSRPVGDRIVNLMKGDQNLDMDAMYELVTNDFLAAGGDGDDMLAAFPTLRRMMALDEAIAEYLLEVRSVAPTVEGRITSVGQASAVAGAGAEGQDSPQAQVIGQPSDQ